MPYIPHTDQERAEMLATIGVSDFDELIAAVPEAHRYPPLDFGPALSEPEVLRLMLHISERNRDVDHTASFLGAGAYNHFIPPAVFSRAARLTFRIASGRAGRPNWNLVISNVPGPQFPLYCAGARLVAQYPVSVITDGMGLNITVMSYCGHLDFGIVADRKQMPDVERLIGWLGEELDALR